MITQISHVNLTVPVGTLDHAEAFYAHTLGFTRVPVPVLQKNELAWFNITPEGNQQVHIAFGPPNEKSSRHACFKLDSPESLIELQRKIWEHHTSGQESAPMEADEVGVSSGAKGVEYPKRFFARDYAGNRLEFSL